MVVVRPRVVAQERLTDSLALCVTSSAFNAAHAEVIQHGVKSHPFTFQLLKCKMVNVIPVLSFSEHVEYTDAPVNPTKGKN